MKSNHLTNMTTRWQQSATLSEEQHVLLGGGGDKTLLGGKTWLMDKHNKNKYKHLLVFKGCYINGFFWGFKYP